MLTAAHITNLPYVDLLALLSESNRPPGGIDTIRRMITATQLRPGMSVLHAGCNAGFLSRELVRRSGAQVVGVDINGAMVQSATDRARLEGLETSLLYVQADMRELPFSDVTFDVVVSGGALAFVSRDREAAISEWQRVVRPNGLLADCELFYERTPPAGLLNRVSEIIGVTVPTYDLEYWLQLFRRSHLEPYYLHIGKRKMEVTKEAVEQYVIRMVERNHNALAEDAKDALYKRLLDIFSVFNENMSYLNYVIFAYVVRPSDFEPALYV